MDMKKTTLFVIGLMLATTLMAGPVGKDEAKVKAQAFLSGKAGGKSGVAKAPRQQRDLSLAATGDAYHVFNIGSGDGFVIVSGSDLTPDIIGYTDEGAFDAQNMPDNMKEWLQEYTNQIAWMEKQGEATASASKVRKAPAGVKAAIAPLIQTKWGQNTPYNNLVPSGCVTGCVATAMAQMLYYCNQNESFPLGTTDGIAEYNDGRGHKVSACPQIPSFDWANMKLNYSGSETSTEQTAVAQLMRYCGASVGMKYGTTSSSNTMYVAEALNNYFGFDNHLKNVIRRQYTAQEWEDILYAELVEGRPAILSGMSSGGGHAFICDGYDADGFFHINWGWKGTGDGYYLLSVLNPNSTGIGAGTSRDGYTMDVDAVIGFKKPTGYSIPEADDAGVFVKEFNYTGITPVENNTANFQCYVNISFSGSATYTHVYDMNIGIFNESDEFVAAHSEYIKNQTVAPGSEYNYNSFLYVNLTHLEAGHTYKLKPVYSLAGLNDWKPLAGSDEHYIQVVTGASTSTLSTVSPIVDLIVSDVQLTTDGIVNTMQTVTAKVKNNSSDDYHGNLYLYKGATQYAAFGLNLEAGESAMTSFSFIPTATSAAETWTIKADGAASVIGSGSITIKSGVSGDTSPSLTITTALPLVMDGLTNKIKGSKIETTLTVKNETGTNYVGRITAILQKKSDESTQYEWKDLTVLAGGTETIAFEFDGLDINDQYKVFVNYIHNGLPEAKAGTSFYPVAKTITTIDANGVENLVLATADFVVPDDVVVVDLRGLSGVVTSLTANANPNCLYIADFSPISGITKNWVNGTTANEVELTDGYDFYTPIDFTATKISYTRTFTTGADGSGKGWNTIVLPFDVATVKQGATAIDWFKSSSDSSKDFWLYQFFTDGKGAVNFDYAGEIRANKPYLITVPSNHWGDEFDLTGKPITFEASDVVIRANAKNTLSGFYYMFIGGSQKQTVAADAGYVLNAEGNKFAKTTGSVDVPAFQAYFYPSTHNLQADALAISFVDNSEATDIQGVDTKQVAADYDNWYTLQGVKLDGKPTKKGIYIYNGKKVAIK